MQIRRVIDAGDHLDVRDDSGLVHAVPKDDGNRQYKEVRTWIEAGGVVESPPAPDLDEVKARAVLALGRCVNVFITAKGDGFPRYDQALKDNLIMAGLQCAMAGKAPPSLIGDVNAWVASVQADYFACKQQIKAAVDSKEVQALYEALVDYNRLEGLFGVAGTQHPDPDVYTEQLAAALQAALTAE